MAPFKQPDSLFSVCLKAIELLINTACDTVLEKHESYDTQLCEPDLRDVQTFCARLPGYILDEVCSLWSSMKRNHKDPRIHVSVYMQECLRCFRFNQINLTLTIYDSSFWRTQLCRANSITNLNLGNTYNDEILEVIGQYCPCLEYIYMELEVPLYTFISDSLKCINDVSDKGLIHLENCKRLKIVALDYEKYCGGPEITELGVRHLVKALPVIESISFPFMGRVIATEDVSNVGSLPLTEIIDHNPQVSHISAASELCKNLQSLSLRFPKGNVDEILSTLKNTALSLSNLKLEKIYVNPVLFELLTEKGKFLISLRLKLDTISKDLIQSLGECCPHLKDLHLEESILYVKQEFDPAYQAVTFSSMKVIFSQLQTLVLDHKRKKSETFLSILLRYAEKIKEITVCMKDYNLDADIDRILALNPLKELRKFEAKCILSFEKILYFFNSPNMVKLTLCRHQGFTSKNVKSLRNKIKENNLDIELNCFYNY